MVKRRILTCKIGELGSWWEICKRRHREYAERIGAEYEIIEMKHSEDPMYERHHYAQWVASSERTLCLDADTVVSRKAPDIFNLHPPGAVYAALDSHPVTDPFCFKHGRLIMDAQAILGPICWMVTYHNFGVILLDSVHHTCFQKWLQIPLFFPTQTMWNYRIRELEFAIRNLDRRWNAIGGLNYGWDEPFAKTHIAHLAGVRGNDCDVLIKKLDQLLP